MLAWHIDSTYNGWQSYHSHADSERFVAAL